MSEGFNLEIVNPEKSFLIKENVSEVVVPAFEGEMGILKDHISIISFLKPGIIKVLKGSEEENFYVEDGIVEFKDNNLSILTSNIFDLKNVNKEEVNNSISDTEKELLKDDLDDQKKFLLNHKIEVLKSINLS
tara:strand:+ start:228 stop:626 length:399 start_codon:yes stop_codon:yes gene_type:complete